MHVPPSQKRPSEFRDDIDVVLFFHPITTNIVHMYERIEEMCEHAPLCFYHVICVEYPGYASACDTTYSSEHSFLTSYPLYVLAALQQEQLSIKRSVAIGYSMGTTLASFMGAYCPWIRAIVLLAPFSSINNVVRDFMHGLHLLIEERFPSKAWIHRVQCHIYIIHGMNDETIPYAHAVELFETATQASYRQLTLVNGLGHVSLCGTGQCVNYGMDAFYKRRSNSDSKQTSRIVIAHARRSDTKKTESDFNF
jgi:pimeloyl-ACP methyl ester carboxylesterase